MVLNVAVIVLWCYRMAVLIALFIVFLCVQMFTDWKNSFDLGILLKAAVGTVIAVVRGSSPPIGSACVRPVVASYGVAS